MIHYPVMLPEVLEALAPRANEVIVDGTFGAGGYSRAILQAASCRLIALDRDPNVAPTVEAFSAEFGARFSFVQTEFSKLDAAVGEASVDGIVLDIGVSSMQLDRAERGFSFMRSGPLDMRMSAAGPSAADAVNHLDHADLVRIFQVYGEERQAKRCADFIVTARGEGAITTTDALADILSGALGRQGKIHPATRVFQALRIYINDELGELYRALMAAERALKPGGRLVVVTFHSLEDRIVKTFLRSRTGEVRGGSRYQPEVAKGPDGSFELTRRSVVKPSKTEIEDNARSRSAKLRFAVRTDVAPWEGEAELGLRVPGLADLERAMV